MQSPAQPPDVADSIGEPNPQFNPELDAPFAGALVELNPDSDLAAQRIKQVQMQLAQSKQMIEQLQQQMQEMAMNMKYGASIKQLQEEAETKRELMRQTSKAYQIDTQAQSAEMIAKLKVDVAANDTVIDNQTKLKIESIKAQLAMLLASLDEKDVTIATQEAIERSI